VSRNEEVSLRCDDVTVGRAAEVNRSSSGALGREMLWTNASTFTLPGSAPSKHTAMTTGFAISLLCAVSRGSCN
jgi:hypothetical protein